MAVGGGSLAAGIMLGWRVAGDLDHAAELKSKLAVERDRTAAAQAALTQSIAAQRTSAALGEASARRQAEIRNVTETIVREVPRYVSSQDNYRCDVPDGFVRLHDSAASGVDPATFSDTAGGADDAASQVSLSSVATVVIGNYGICRADQERLEALQAWVKAQSEIQSGRMSAANGNAK